MGVNRDLKKATEAYWGGKISQDQLLAEGKRLRQEHWKLQKDAGIDVIPSNDFSFYDHVLDHIQLFGVSLPLESLSVLNLSPALPINTCRQFPKDTPNTSSHRSMNSSRWGGVFRDLQRMARLL